MYQLYIMTKRDFKNILMNVPLLFSNILFPLLMIYILGLASKGVYGGLITSFDYYGVTILIYTTINISMTASNIFMDEGIKQGNFRTVYAPISKSSLYISKIIATTIFSSACTMITIALSHFLFRVQWGSGVIGYIFLIFVLFSLFSAAVGVFCCTLIKSEDLTNTILSIVNSVIAVLGGLFFQLDGFGTAARLISYLSPARWVSEGIFKIIYDNNFIFFLPLAIILISFTLLLIYLCKFTFRLEDYLIK